MISQKGKMKLTTWIKQSNYHPCCEIYIQNNLIYQDRFSLMEFITVILPFLAVSVVFSTAVIVDTVVVIKHLTSIY